MANISSDKILARLKGLRAQLREGEQPLFSIPAIWENATTHQSNACDLVLTNQRIFGYIYTTFPRERLFLDALDLQAITAVSIRQKNFEAMFRELLVSDHQQRIYIRATSKKIEEIYTALRAAIAEHVPTGQPAEPAQAPSTTQAEPGQHASPARETQPSDTLGGQRGEQPGDAGTGLAEQQDQSSGQQHEQSQPNRAPTYSRQRLHQPLERSPLGITVLLVGGLALEIIGVLGWVIFGNPQMGSALLLTGLFAVIVATIARRQRR